MFVINEDKSIYANRGDIVFFSVSAEDDGVPYKFQPGDIVRMSIYGKKDAESCFMQKDFPVSKLSEDVFIYLGEEDTKLEDIISKHKDYWYEVVLNPDTAPQTIVGYDEDGAKVFRLFPESAEIDDDYEPSEEDFPVVDEELDMTSPRPVSNRAIARAVANILETCERTSDAVKELHVTPEMFGAIGDGVADDTEAIALAVIYGIVTLTAGKTYKISGSIEVPADTKIDGNFATLSLGVDSSLAVTGDNVKIERIRFVSNKENRYGIDISAGVKDTVIRDIYGEGLQYSLIMNNGERTLVSGATAVNCGWDCVSNYTNAKYATIKDCYAIRCGRHGFSTDEGAEYIKFINCHAEDIGWIDGEGHTCFHLEGARNCEIIKCRALYTSNHPAVTKNFSGILNACRIDSANTAMTNNSIEGLDIVYEDGFTTNGKNQVFALYLHSAVNPVPYVDVKDLWISNHGTEAVNVYHGNMYVRLDGFRIFGDVYWKQQNANGYILEMKNGTIETTNMDREFYYAQHLNIGMHCNNVLVKNSGGLANGRFVDCVFENCVFDSCSYSVSLVQGASNSNDKSTGNIIRNNILKDLGIGVRLGWWTGTGNNFIIDNVLKGHFDTILRGDYCGCVFARNINGNMTYETATHNVTAETEIPVVAV